MFDTTLLLGTPVIFKFEVYGRGAYLGLNGKYPAVHVLELYGVEGVPTPSQRFDAGNGYWVDPSNIMRLDEAIEQSSK